MVTVQKDEYRFEVDFEKTKAYYQSHSLCDCDYCANFYSQIKGKFPKLEAFLAEFGVDISRPDEISSVESENSIDYINVDYTVCGKIKTMGQYEIDLNDVLFLSIVVTNGFASPNEQTDSYFTFSVFGIILPWVLDKPLLQTESIHLKRTKKFLDKIKGFFMKGNARKQHLSRA